MIEGSYSGPIPEDHDYGGTCTLTLANGRFELAMVRTAPYSIEYGDIIRGTYIEHTGRIVLEAREHYQYHSEKQESTTPMTRSFVVSVGMDETTGLIALRMRIDFRTHFETRLLADIPRIGEGPQTLIQIIGELRRIDWESRAYWNRFSTADFFAPLAPDAWSPGDHVRHLTKSIRPVTGALKLPKLAIRLMFGTPNRPSRSFAKVRDDYRAALVPGVTAGRFTPRPMDEKERTESTRQKLMARHSTAVENLEATVARWDEHGSDTCRVPHPLLGKLTVREMLFFTLYHTVHHVQVAERRRHSAA